MSLPSVTVAVASAAAPVEPPPASKDTDVEKNGTPSTEALGEQVPGPPPHSVFSDGTKVCIIVLVSLSALISPFGATTFLPALNVLSRVLHISPTQTNISITTYMIAQALAPAFIGAMSDSSGRRRSFITCFIIFCIGNIGLALQTNYVALLLLRMVQAIGGTAAISLTFAVVADIATSAERGKYMGYAGAGILMGPAFGPTIGGVLAHFLGWRAIFWFLTIFSGTLLIVFVIFFPETCRNVVGNGSIPARGIDQSVLGWYQHRKRVKRMPPRAHCEEETRLTKQRKSFPNPMATFRIIAEKESAVILLYNGFFFTGMMSMISAIPDLYSKAYHLGELNIGLCYIASGMGSLSSSLTMGHVVDWNFRRHARKVGMSITKGRQQDLSNFDVERVRMQVVAPGHIIGLIGMITFGWTVKFQTHLAGPEIALFITALGSTTAFNISNNLLIDLHRDQPATATAAINFTRCLMSAGGSAAIIPMCNAMNPGWAFTLMALIYAVLILVVFWVMKNGMRWRKELDEKRRVEQKKREEKEEPSVIGK